MAQAINYIITKKSNIFYKIAFKKAIDIHISNKLTTTSLSFSTGSAIRIFNPKFKGPTNCYRHTHLDIGIIISCIFDSLGLLYCGFGGI